MRNRKDKRMSTIETSIEYVIYDPVDENYMGKGDAGWIISLDAAKRWLKPENAERHCYLDRMQVLPVHVVKTVEVSLEQQ